MIDYYSIGKTSILIFSIFTILICVGLTFILNIVSGQQTEEQELEIKLEVEKLQEEVELLNEQIKNNSSNSDVLFTQIFSILAGISAAGFTAFFAWQRERRIPPTMEQERIIQDIIKEWYSRNHLNAYYKIWEIIEESNNDEKVIDVIWQKLCRKKFPEEYLDKEQEEKDLSLRIEYFRTKFHLSKGETSQITNRIQSIQNSADVEFYTRVRLILPTIVDIAVMAAIDSKDRSTPTNILDEDFENIVQSSLKNLKKLMIFYRVRENNQVCEILIRAKLKEKPGSPPASTDEPVVVPEL